MWSYEDFSEEWTQEGLYLLPSDSSKRNDLDALKNLEYEKAQIYKDELENIQRKDKKAREATKKF